MFLISFFSKILAQMASFGHFFFALAFALLPVDWDSFWRYLVRVLCGLIVGVILGIYFFTSINAWTMELLLLGSFTMLAAEQRYSLLKKLPAVAGKRFTISFLLLFLGAVHGFAIGQKMMQLSLTEQQIIFAEDPLCFSVMILFIIAVKLLFYSLRRLFKQLLRV